jgi:hypothetical protein
MCLPDFSAQAITLQLGKRKHSGKGQSGGKGGGKIRKPTIAVKKKKLITETGIVSKDFSVDFSTSAEIKR